MWSSQRSAVDSSDWLDGDWPCSPCVALSSINVEWNKDAHPERDEGKENGEHKHEKRMNAACPQKDDENHKDDEQGQVNQQEIRGCKC